MTKILRHFDWVLLLSVLLLVGIGMMALWSLSPGRLFWRQGVWVAFSLLLLFSFAAVDYRIFRNHGGILVLFLLIGVFLLLALLFWGPTTRGVAGWFRVGGIDFQPAELMKLVLLLILAKYFSRKHIAIYQVRHLLVSASYVFVPVLLVLVQPDLGSAVILSFLWLSVAMFAGIAPRHLFLVCAVGIFVALFAWGYVLAPYQKERISIFLDPYRDPRGAGYNTIQAMVTVGSGEIVGKGIGYGTQSHLHFLPEAETDFIFAAFAEETGFIGACILLGAFAFFFWRCAVVGYEAQDNFSKLFVLGFSSLIFSQILVHVGANTGLLPVTGITLPFISYGGSSLTTLMAGVGILESIRIYSRRVAVTEAEDGSF